MRFLTQLIVSIVTVAATRCPLGPPQVSTYSGGFNYKYDWPIQYKHLETQHLSLCQAYMDVTPPSDASLNQTIVLLHGKNFWSQTWNATIDVLTSNGHRVIAPDQIGLCKSDKPGAYQFSLQQLALNTKSILDDPKIETATTMGHSIGGMLAARFALTYPQMVERLVMVNPISLEDWKAKGVPYLSIDEIYKSEAASNYTSIAGYENATYYVGKWKPEYDVWVNMLLQVYDGQLGKQFAFDQALLTDMVLTQPVIYEFPLLAQVPHTLLVIGEKDNTAIGKQWSPPEIRPKLGRYDLLGPAAARAIGDNCTYLPYPNLGHAPHISDPDMFHADLLQWLQETEV